MLDKIHIFISLIAGVIYTIYAITQDFEFFLWLQNVIIVLILFYILGLICRSYLKKLLATNEPAQDEVSVSEEDGNKEETNAENNADSDEERRKRRRFDFNIDDDEEQGE